MYTVNCHMNKGSNLEIFIYYSEQWIFLNISFRGYIYVYMYNIWTQNMMKMSPWDIWRDAEVRSGEIFVCCSQISGHQSGFLYVQELKPSNSCTAITWCDWMFYRDLVRYLCFVTRYQVICWDNGTSIYWYLLFECDMFHVLYINS